MMRAAIYARVSTVDQTAENQLLELRRYIEARGWIGTEFVDRGVSGAKDRRPALDALLKDAKRRRFDVLVCWRLDRLGRNLRQPPAQRSEIPQRVTEFLFDDVTVAGIGIAFACGQSAESEERIGCETEVSGNNVRMQPQAPQP
jgi:hypothetical protein